MTTTMTTMTTEAAFSGTIKSRAELLSFDLGENWFWAPASFLGMFRGQLPPERRFPVIDGAIWA